MVAVSERHVFAERRAFMILNALPNIGPHTMQRLLAAFHGDARRILSATADQLKMIPRVETLAAETIVNHRKYFNPEQEEALLAALRGRFIAMADENYPKLLGEIPDAPIGLYAIGEIDNSLKNIAIIGSRTNTLYGLEIARKLAMDLSNRGFCIVSGMARGIDSAAHEGALAANGKTIAVFGNGVDVIYPMENAALYKKISENGAIVSEFTLGRRADKQTFPIRNRLIAGLCHAVIIVESDKFGGSMITARFASEYGRHVFAVPGRIDQPSSSGCLSLIREGATMLTCVEDIFEDLPYLCGIPEQKILSSVDFMPINRMPQVPQISCPIERKVFDVIADEKSANLESVVKHSDLPPNSVVRSLQMLEMRGLTRKRYDGAFEVALRNAS